MLRASQVRPKRTHVRTAGKSHKPLSNAPLPAVSFNPTPQILQDVATIARRGAASLGVNSADLMAARRVVRGAVDRIARPVWLKRRGQLLPLPPCDVAGNLIRPDGRRILSLTDAAAAVGKSRREMLHEYLAAWLDILTAGEPMMLGGGASCD